MRQGSDTWLPLHSGLRGMSGLRRFQRPVECYNCNGRAGSRAAAYTRPRSSTVTNPKTYQSCYRTVTNC